MDGFWTGLWTIWSVFPPRNIDLVCSICCRARFRISASVSTTESLKFSSASANMCYQFIERTFWSSRGWYSGWEVFFLIIKYGVRFDRSRKCCTDGLYHRQCNKKHYFLWKIVIFKQRFLITEQPDSGKKSTRRNCTVWTFLWYLYHQNRLAIVGEATIWKWSHKPENLIFFIL